MNVLLLRLVGPLQSWGVQSRHNDRDTGLEPSKSGVIGLVCAALGRPRHAEVDDLAALCMGVRVDQEGMLRYDYHTAQQILQANGEIKDTEISKRNYLADAKFLVGLAGESAELLRQVQQALAEPVWPLALGRKAFVPGEPIWLADGLRLGVGLEEALATYPSLVTNLDGDRRAWAKGDAQEAACRMVLESDAGREVRPDQPISFARREFGVRRVRTSFVTAPPRLSAEASPTVDPDIELKGGV